MKVKDIFLVIFNNGKFHTAEGRITEKLSEASVFLSKQEMEDEMKFYGIKCWGYFPLHKAVTSFLCSVLEDD
jgi:hypothetical protein